MLENTSVCYFRVTVHGRITNKNCEISENCSCMLTVKVKILHTLRIKLRGKESAFQGQLGVYWQRTQTSACSAGLKETTKYCNIDSGYLLFDQLLLLLLLLCVIRMMSVALGASL